MGRISLFDFNELSEVKAAAVAIDPPVTEEASQDEWVLVERFEVDIKGGGRGTMLVSTCGPASTATFIPNGCQSVRDRVERRTVGPPYSVVRDGLLRSIKGRRAWAIPPESPHSS